MPHNPKLIKSQPGAAPDLRYRPNPKQSLRMKAWWNVTKKKLAHYEQLLRENSSIK